MDQDLREVVSELPDAYLECRMTSHRWKRQGDPLQEGRGLYVIRWRCPECRAQRFYRVTLEGTVYARWYKQPKGYAISGFGHETRKKDIYFSALIARLELDEEE